MSKTSELKAPKTLKKEEQAAFNHERQARKALRDSRRSTSDAYNLMETAWQERTAAYEKMSHEFRLLQASRNLNRGIWDEYGETRNRIMQEREKYCKRANSEHKKMCECFRLAEIERSSGSKTTAEAFEQQGHEHRKNRNKLNKKVRTLSKQLCEARKKAQTSASKIDKSAYLAARDAFIKAKSKHESAQAEYKNQKANLRDKKLWFKATNKRHKTLRKRLKPGTTSSN